MTNPGNVPNTTGSPTDIDAVLEGVWSDIDSRLATVPLGSVYRGPVGMHPNATVVMDNFGDLNKFQNAVSVYADGSSSTVVNPIWNTLGQNWQKSGPLWMNRTTPRIQADGATPLWSSQEIDFLLDGSNVLQIVTAATDAVTPYGGRYSIIRGTVEENGTIYRLPDIITPAGFSGFCQLGWKFTNSAPRRIRALMPPMGFHSVIIESQGEIGYAPSRNLIPIVSDSYADAASWGLTSFVTELSVLTGIRFSEGGEGSTGWFNNGSGQNSESAGNYNSHYFFNDVRFNYLADIALGESAKPLAILTNGSGNDNAFLTSSAQMKARVMQAMDKVKTRDSKCKFISLGWEPVTTFATGNGRTYHDTGLKDAHAEHSISGGVAFPSDDKGRKWFSGGGKAGSVPTPPTSESRYVGQDGVHLYPPVGPEYYAFRAANSLAHCKVYKERVRK